MRREFYIDFRSKFNKGLKLFLLKGGRILQEVRSKSNHAWPKSIAKARCYCQKVTGCFFPSFVHLYNLRALKRSKTEKVGTSPFVTALPLAISKHQVLHVFICVWELLYNYEGGRHLSDVQAFGTFEWHRNKTRLFVQFLLVMFSFTCRRRLAGYNPRF